MLDPIRNPENVEIRRILEENMGFIASDDDLAAVVRENRMTKILVRCGSGRFVCPAQDAKHFVNIINNSDNDYVRDLSILVEW